MISHYVTIDTVAGEYPVKCSCGNLNKKFKSRDAAFSVAHMHIAGLDVDLIELALAGKADHV